MSTVKAVPFPVLLSMMLYIAAQPLVYCGDTVAQTTSAVKTDGSMSDYCDKIVTQIKKSWIKDPEITVPIQMEITVSSTGKISDIKGTATNDLRMFKIAQQQILKLGNVDTPPLQAKQPLRIYLRLSNEQEGITASSLSIADLSPYMERMQKRVRRYFHVPNKGTFTWSIFQFKLWRDGTISDIKLVRSNGFDYADSAGEKALENSSPQETMPDGSPRFIDTQFRLDYLPTKKQTWN
ncbi:MAG: TonB C-terminal domain-containing protein [Candidatus Obscuribacterales bacterium]|nr:TonB C-terminal domain-containing protein [Candidatus Obscuribacterales bacterium]